jgi:hypothetical protein
MTKTKDLRESGENKDKFYLNVCEEIKISGTCIFGVAVFRNKTTVYAFNNVKTKDIEQCITRAKEKLHVDKVTGYYEPSKGILYFVRSIDIV